MFGKRWVGFLVAVLLLAAIMAPVTAKTAAARAGDGPRFLAVQAETDSDGDGLTDDREAELGTDPTLADTDGDELSDGEEVDFLGTDPLNPLGDLSISIFTCAPGTESLGQCEATPGVAVNLGLATGELLATATTDADGNVQFTDLEADTYVIAEDIPGDALADLQVMCGAGGEGFPVEPSTPTGITLETAPGRDFGCGFFNFPTDNGNGGGTSDDVEITVQAFVCPVEYDGGDFATDCDDPADGVLVSVALNGSEFQTSDETDADGTVTFGDLGAGVYTVELGVPGDFADFQVSCGAPGVPEALTIDGAGTNRIGIELGEGARPTCTWFIIPVNAAGVTPTAAPPTATTAATVTAATATATATAPVRSAGPVSGLPNTGTGSAGGQTGGVITTLLLALLALLGSMVSTLAVGRRVNRS
ncbi:MAG: SpaA isopeptide-forming pilin-related protein [Chloroflexota bacterium]|nr:SpaA isopeptide-forming pilin-related protein [Chloroflexota bacterium]